MPSGLWRPAVLAAASLHLAVFLWLFHPWRSAPEHLPPADLPVTLIFEPPARPAPPEPQKAPQVGGDRSSGPDEQTTAPPSGEADEVKNEDKTAALEPEPPAALRAGDLGVGVPVDGD